MRILHTSDWHLGVSAEQAPRDEEHELFLDWLLDEIKSQDIDVLLNTGDTFHYVQPASRCMKSYYNFLARCARETNLKQIVIIGGNHDSPSRLDAPQPILENLHIKVVGGIYADETTWDRCLVPVHGEDGRIEAVIVAVPYVHEAKLGIVTTGKTPKALREEMIEGFTHLYTHLATRAEELYPTVPLIATGHLTCYEQDRGHVDSGDYHTPLHLIEALGSLPPSIFDSQRRYSYVALGHIHQMMRMPSVNAWYAGSPVPTDIIEARTPRFVLRVDTDLANPRKHARVTPLEVPAWRPIYEISGSPEEAIAAVEGLPAYSELSPYLYIDVKVGEPMHDGLKQFHNVLDMRRPELRGRVVRFRELLEVPEDGDGAPTDYKKLSAMTPSDVFAQMYRLKYETEVPEDIMTAFLSLLVEDPEAAES